VRIQLRRQRTHARVAVEAFEERIFRGLLEDELGLQAFGELARKAGLADTDRPFDRNEAM
jgi:hypothetical protein